MKSKMPKCSKLSGKTKKPINYTWSHTAEVHESSRTIKDEILLFIIYQNIVNVWFVRQSTRLLWGNKTLQVCTKLKTNCILGRVSNPIARLKSNHIIVVLLFWSFKVWCYTRSFTHREVDLNLGINLKVTH